MSIHSSHHILQTDILTTIPLSCFDHHRAPHPTGLLQPQLATLRRRGRLPRSSISHDDSRCRRFGQSQHRSNESKVPRPRILAHSYLSGHPGDGYERDEHPGGNHFPFHLAPFQSNLAPSQILTTTSQTFIFSHRKPHVSARQVRIYGAGAKDQVISRTSSQRSLQLGIKREEYPHPPTYSPQPAHENAFKRATKRLTGRFPIKISGPMMRSKDAADNAHLQPPTNNDDAASSHYSRNSEGVPFPEEAYHPSMRQTHAANMV